MTDSSGLLKSFWGFNSTGDIIRFEIGSSVLSEDYVDVYYDLVFKIPMDIYLNDVELDVNANATFFDYWEDVFWDRILLPIEDGQYNNFDVLEDQGIENPIICANINKIGFRMCGGVELYRQVISEKKCRFVAMSVLASGAIPAKEALDWVCNLEGLDSIVFGASSSANIRQTKQIIDEAWV